MTTTSTEARPEADPVLVALASRNPEHDTVTHRVRLLDDSSVFISGERLKVKPEEGGSARLRFRLTDGTVRDFEPYTWASCIEMPAVVPVLDRIIYRLYLIGEATLRDIHNPGAWLQAQPEWIENERVLLADDPASLADAERIHRLRAMGL